MKKIQTIHTKLLTEVAAQAKTSPRKRMNYNFHETLTDPINRMLNALEPETYIRPHRHKNPDKDEIFLVLKGKIGALVFDDLGNIIHKEIISSESGFFGLDIPAGLFHTVVSLESGSVCYEVKLGPYEKALPENFASWAPDEGSEEANEYLNLLKENLLGS